MGKFNTLVPGALLTKNNMRMLSVFILAGLALFAVNPVFYSSSIDEIKKRGELVVLTRNAPTTYYEIRDKYAGLEYELAEAFAVQLGVKTRYIVKDNIDDIFQAIRDKQADLAAAGLTRTEQRSNGFQFSSAYQKVQQQVVCRRGGPRPKKEADLVDVSLAVPARSSYIEALKKLKQKLPALNWSVDQERDTEALLEQVWERHLDCTIADSNIVAINRRYYPELVVRFDLTQPQPLGWLFHKDNDDLKHKVNQWLAEQKSSGKLEQLLQKYYGFIEIFDYVDNRTYQRRIKKKLPRYKDIFKKVADQYQFPWTLLAAQAYQESHWNPRAKSPTGVRGMMMLTLVTAREQGIKNRLDPLQSVRGGARYLSRLMKRIPDDVKQPDRTWFALAAYNMGMGHLYDARRLARQLGKSPSLWKDLEQVLPLLAQKKYYRKLKYGYARGHEPVRYVQRIRNYKDILERVMANADNKTKATTAAND